MLQMHAARAEELPRIREIWKTVFGDDDTFIDRFLEACPLERIQVLLEEGTVQSFLALLPATLVLPDAEPAKLDYVYALCTHPDWRGRGLGGQILNYADYFSRTRWARVICTVPAEESLHQGFFKRWGYREGFTTYVTGVDTAALPGVGEADAIAALDAAEYNRQREKLLSGLAHVAYPDAALELQRYICHSSGGDLCRVTVDGVTGVAAVEMENGRALVRELLIRPDLTGRALALIARAFSAAACQVRTPRPTGLVGEERVAFGMWKSLDGSPRPALSGGGGYLGLAFD